jgi:hypothetical protein
MALTKLNYTGQGTIPIASIPTITGAKMPAGSVIQTVQDGTTTEVVTSNNSTYVSTTNTCSITPSSASSKILISISQVFATITDNHCKIRIMRDSTNIKDYLWSKGTQSAGHSPTSISLIYLDSPNTTSQITYDTYLRSRDSGEDAYAQYAGGASTITLQEIKV